MDSQLFEQKLLQLQDNLLNFAYMLTSDRDEAEDLLQDTTLKALDNSDKYRQHQFQRVGIYHYAEYFHK